MVRSVIRLRPISGQPLIRDHIAVCNRDGSLSALGRSRLHWEAQREDDDQAGRTFRTDHHPEDQRGQRRVNGVSRVIEVKKVSQWGQGGVNGVRDGSTRHSANYVIATANQKRVNHYKYSRIQVSANVSIIINTVEYGYLRTCQSL